MVSKRKGELEENEDFRSTACGENIWFPSKSGNGNFPNVSFAAEQGEFIAIVERDGSGKSTLLNLAWRSGCSTEEDQHQGHDIGSLTRRNRRFLGDAILDLCFRLQSDAGAQCV